MLGLNECTTVPGLLYLFTYLLTFVCMCFEYSLAMKPQALPKLVFIFATVSPELRFAFLKKNILISIIKFP